MWKKIDVICYSGYKVNERPKKILIGKKLLKIKKILDSWYEGGLKASQPKLDYFKVLTETNQKFLIRYNSFFDKWSLWDN